MEKSDRVDGETLLRAPLLPPSLSLWCFPAAAWASEGNTAVESVCVCAVRQYVRGRKQIGSKDMWLINEKTRQPYKAFGN